MYYSIYMRFSISSVSGVMREIRLKPGHPSNMSKVYEALTVS